MSTTDPADDLDVGVLERQPTETEAAKTETELAKKTEEAAARAETTGAPGEPSLEGLLPVDITATEPGTQAMGASVAPAEGLITQPIEPISITRRVSGAYKSNTQPWELVLRVDTDGNRPTRRFSGDFNRTSGWTKSYFGSFIVDYPAIYTTATQVTIIGYAKTTWATSYNKIQVTIPRNTIFQPPATATVQFMTASNVKGAKYSCAYDSGYFRTVQLEQDREQDVTPFISYNTGSLPSGGPARTLTVAKAYAEAGIGIQDTGMSNIINTSAAGPDTKWNNSELHLAMQNNFSRWRNDPQWKVWLFHANKHVNGPGLYGIMFDQQDKQRQGCAAFYQGVGGSTATKLRDQLYVCVHELGHCFNLFHSFHKTYMIPPMPNRPAALSWMNYPQNYPGGSGAFWSAFPFQFDTLELIHLRHAFRDNIIMGGNPFGIGAALEDPRAFADVVDDQSGLELNVRAPKSFAFGEPVYIETKLGLTDTRGRTAHIGKQLDPNCGIVQFAIQKPSGQVYVYEPPIEQCILPEATSLDMKTMPAVYNSSYIGYDKAHGQIFDQPGTYKVRAVYYALDGSEVVSNIERINVRSPLSQADQEAAELMLGDEQGMLLYLSGSESPYLQNGNDALDLMLDKYGDHSLATHARLAKGSCMAREFKTIDENFKVSVRKPDIDSATELLGSVVTDSEGVEGVDNITLNKTIDLLASCQAECGKKKEAQDTAKQLYSVFQKKKLNPLVLNQIKTQSEELKQKIQQAAQ